MYSDDEYISDSEISDTDNETIQLNEYKNDILQEEFEYEEFIFMMNIIKEFRRYDDPLILDQLTTINLIQFLTNCDT